MRVYEKEKDEPLSYTRFYDDKQRIKTKCLLNFTIINEYLLFKMIHICEMSFLSFAPAVDQEVYILTVSSFLNFLYFNSQKCTDKIFRRYSNRFPGVNSNTRLPNASLLSARESNAAPRKTEL